MVSRRPSHPNVLFIMSDQHHARVLGHRGDPHAHTPHLDRLAAGGVSCGHAVAQSPICTPSRVSFLSGQYCHNHGYYGLGGPSPGGLPSAFEVFRRHDYFTAAIGKIHCPDGWLQPHVDRFREVTNASREGNDDYRAYLAAQNLENVADFERLPEFGERGWQTLDARASRLAYKHSPEGWSVRETLAAIETARAGGKPFFTWISFCRPHQVSAASEPFWSLFGETPPAAPAAADARPAHKPPNLVRTADGFRDAATWALFEPRTFEAARARRLRGYYASVAMVDHAVGELMDALSRLGILHDTIVVYSSDHGDFVTRYGIMEKAPGISSDAVCRIPLIWHWPKAIRAGHSLPAIVEAVDTLPTLLALCDLPALPTCDGQDLSAHLTGRPDAPPLRDLGLTENVWGKAIVHDGWRYVHYPRETFSTDYPEGFGELYDLQADPEELHNRFFDPACASRLADLRELLLDRLITTTRVRTLHPPVSRTGDGWHGYTVGDTDADGKVGPAHVRQTLPRTDHFANYL